MRFFELYKNFNKFVFFIGLLFCSTAFSQQKNLYHVPPPSAVKGKDFVVSASLIDISSPIEAVLYYKTPLSDSYLETPFENKGFNWEAVIPKFAITDSGLDYVIVFRFSDSRILSYPRIDPFNNPYSIQVIDDPTKQSMKISNDKAEILILSPEIDEILNPNEVFIAASFFFR